ncbi:NDUFA2, NADH ubiquinone oxidoreductase 10.5kD subunit [Hygrophoropsis aurantiaca]|uniref:NDUFA2, NADH ubiquinone oxidoreductase 10.5kD subunit n=1 Tax=Hygrophoropsis aurantiaca TaxID=72124 RepID=A0ACB8ARZ5_9AGAM|nr:NDUFA2, NADH ubiquinone oxidoreductase 10.5kD subunit [Hygrophoropsis aurantiaca]
MSAFAKAFSPALREIRVLCSQSGQASEGTRQFLLSTYPIIKKHNPDLPVMIREASGTPARVFARFEYGVEKHVELDNLSSSDVATKVGQLLTVP